MYIHTCTQKNYNIWSQTKGANVFSQEGNNPDYYFKAFKNYCNSIKQPIL